MEVCVYFSTKNHATRRKIMERFGMKGITVNYETWCDVPDEDMPVLRKCEEMGYIQIRNKPKQTCITRLKD